MKIVNILTEIIEPIWIWAGCIILKASIIAEQIIIGFSSLP